MLAFTSPIPQSGICTVRCNTHSVARTLQQSAKFRRALRTRTFVGGAPPASPPSGRGGGGRDDEWKDFEGKQPSSNNPLAVYADLLNRYPISTKTITSVIISASGDLVAQLLENRNSGKPRSEFKWALRRTASFGAMGALLAPMMHVWFNTLDRLFPGGRFAPLKKLALDQGVFAWIMNCTSLFALSVFAGNSIGYSKNRTQQQIVPTIKANYKLWPAAQLISFSLLPPQFRVLFANVVSFGWFIFLSLSTTS